MYTLQIQSVNCVNNESFATPEEVRKRVLEVGQRAVIGYSKNIEDGWILNPWDYSLTSQPEAKPRKEVDHKAMKVMQFIKVDGIVYDVLLYETVAEISQQYPNTGKHLKQNGIAGRFLIRRPKGKNLYRVSLSEKGNLLKVVRADG